MVDYRHDQPTQGCGYAAGQRHGLQFDVYSAVALLESGNAVKLPDEPISLAGRKLMLAAPAVCRYFSHQGCAGDNVDAPLVQNEIMRDVLALNGGIDEEDFLRPDHGNLLLLSG